MAEACIQGFAALEKSSVPDLHKTEKRSNLWRPLAAHRLERRRLVPDGIDDDDGHIVNDALEAGCLLQTQWAPVFAGGTCSSIAQDVLSSSVAQVLVGTMFAWPPGRMADIAKKFPGASRGPDGLSHSFRGHFPPGLSGLLDDIAGDMTRGIAPPP